jgi:hypothetical protein
MTYLKVPAHVQADAERDAKAHGSTLAYAAGPDDLSELSKISNAAPTKAELLERFGDEGYRENPDGTWTLDVSAERARDRADVADALKPQMRLEIERGGKTQAAMPRTKVRRKDGVVVEVSPENERAVCVLMGSVPVIHHGGLRCERFSDGLLWRKVGARWECTGKCAFTRPYFPCRSPDCDWCGAGRDEAGPVASRRQGDNPRERPTRTATIAAE